MAVFSLATLGIILVSAAIDRKRTWAGLREGMTMLLSVLPTFLTVLVLAAVALYIIPPDAIKDHLGQGQGVRGIVIAAGIGSMALMPGFVAFPLAAILIKQGASIYAVSAFITTLMMVGIITLPAEFRYLGVKAAVLRNAISLIAAIIVAVLMGLTYAWR